MTVSLEIGSAIVVFMQLVMFIRWLTRREGVNRVNRIFVSDMATNHLPHIYDALHKLCAHNGVQIMEPPRIKWVDLNDDK